MINVLNTLTAHVLFQMAMAEMTDLAVKFVDNGKIFVVSIGGARMFGPSWA